MNKDFATQDLTGGQLNALVKNIMRQMGIDDPNEAVRLVNSGEWIITKPTRNWREQDGVIYLTVTSDGTTGPQWIDRLAKKGFRVGTYAESILRSADFKPTTGIIYEIAVLKGMLFEDSNRITKKIRTKAESRKLTTPNAEVACLIRENFSDKEIEAMGLIWLVTMHEPIKDSDGDLRLLDATRRGGGSWLHTRYGNPDDGWDREDGFAFVVSQVSVLKAQTL